MRYWALTNGTQPDPVGLMRFDDETLIPAYFSYRTQDWVDDGELFDVVTGRDSSDAYPVDETEAERIKTTVLTAEPLPL